MSIKINVECIECGDWIPADEQFCLGCEIEEDE